MTTTESGVKSAPSGDTPTGLSRIIDVILRIPTSWLGRLTAYIAAIPIAAFAYQKLPEPIKRLPLWLQITFLATPPALALVFQEIPAFLARRRIRRLREITGIPQPGYFQLAPREDQSSFKRADGQHEEILQWLHKRTRPVCYLTGLSGSGKSSLLTAWVLPKLEASGTVVIRLRGYQDPIAALEQELQKPGVIWQKPTTGGGSAEALLERASRHVRPKRILVVLDQFEEFVILQDWHNQRRFRDFLSSVEKKPLGDVAFLFVFRSDYTGPVQHLGLPPIDQSSNWREVSTFSESAAREFLRGSGLQISDELMRDVLREATEIEQTKGFIRPITINLCGLVMGRFATGLPRGFRPGRLIRGFLRESISLPPVRDIAPVLLPHLISDSITKRPRTVAGLAQEIGFDPAEVRGCLSVLGQRDRAIVRSLDADQQIWEISHDFLVPLLDSIVSRWTVSVWRQTRPWLPWAAAAVLVVVAAVASSWRTAPNPIAELTELGWQVHRNEDLIENKTTFIELSFEGAVPEGSHRALQRLDLPLHVKLGSLDKPGSLDESVSELRSLNNLTELDLSSSGLSEVLSLRELTNLTQLDLSFTHESDISPLKELKNLVTLDLKFSHVTDISPLKELSNLRTLNLSGTEVSDLTPLRGLQSLTELDLSSGQVSWSSMKELNSLPATSLASTLLSIDRHNRVSDISSLKGLRNLSRLYLSGSGVSDVLPLKGLKNLTELDLSGTRVSDISPLRDLQELTDLDLSHTQVSDVSPLKDLRSLHWLFLSGSQVRDVSSLKGLRNLGIL